MCSPRHSLGQDNAHAYTGAEIARYCTSSGHVALADSRHAHTTTRAPQRSPSDPSTRPATSSYLFDHRKHTYKRHPPALRHTIARTVADAIAMADPIAMPAQRSLQARRLRGSLWRTRTMIATIESHSPNPGSAALPRLRATHPLYLSARRVDARPTTSLEVVQSLWRASLAKRALG
jgi:hypothetical protein